VRAACALLLSLALAGCGSGDAPSPYIYAWAWDRDGEDSDFLAVIDADPSSGTYGEVVNSILAGVAGGAHHTEHRVDEGGRLFANAFGAGRTFVFDLSDARNPAIEASFGAAGPFAFPHSFERTGHGTVLATLQARAEDRGATGGLVELDSLGGFVRGSDAANDVDPELRPYSLALVPRLDRVVTTSADMAGERTGRSIQVWRLSDLELLHTVLLPPGLRGDEHLHPGEVRLLEDGESVMVTTFRCGMYLVRGLEDEPRATLVLSFPWAPAGDEDTDCNLPVRTGRWWVQTVGTTGSLVVLDLLDPERPVVADELSFGDAARPHWISLEPGGDRIVLTGGGSLGGGVTLVRLDRDTGTLSLIDDFRTPGSDRLGVRFDRERWPHGATGPAFAHGAVFAR